MIFAEDVNGIQRIERNTLIMNNDEKEIKLESIENHGCNDKNRGIYSSAECWT